MTTTLHPFLGKSAVPEDSACALAVNCMGAGWCMADDGNVTACGCEHGRRGRSTWARLKSGIPREAFEWKGLEVPSDRHREVIQAAEQYVTGFNRREPVGIIMGGGTGRGKSRLMGCIAAALAEDGITVQWHRWDDLLRDIRSSYSAKDGRPSESDIMGSLTLCSMLVLDDLGAEAVKEGSEWTEATLTAILDHALRNGRPGIGVTTNLSAKEIGDRYGERVLGRLLESARRDRGGLVIRFDGMCDFRRKMHKEERE